MTLTANKLQGEAAQQTAASLEALFEEHWPRIYAVLFRLTGDHAEAEDLALDVFWRLYTRPPRQDHNLAGWLYRVATRLGFNALRAQRRRQRLEEQAGIQALEANPGRDPAAEAERNQEREQVQSVLERMKPRSAQILILRSNGMSYAEIAEALKITPGSVGTLLDRAEREFERLYPIEE